MKNLKKVLALVMAFAMAFTMMATAGAAYTDQADIEATEAVDMLTTLGIMSGDPDGSFRPNDTITRAEACRMIYSIRTNSDDASAYANMQTTFTDVSSDAWYAGYVKHCQSVGIVSGRSETTFDPNSDVTGVELALMCLRVMGYDPAKANIGGSTWSTTTIGLATEAGLLEDVTASITSACPRQFAAQIMYNMLDSRTVRWSNDSESYTDLNMGGGYMNRVGMEYLKLYVNIGTLVDVDGQNLTIDMSESDREDSDNGTQSFTNVGENYTSLLGQKVKVLFRDNKANDVIGVYATGDNTVYTADMRDIERDGSKVKFDGASYSFDDNEITAVRLDVNDEAISDTFTMSAADFDTYSDNASGADKTAKLVPATVTFVDNDNDGKLNIAIITEYLASEVTYVGSDRIVAGTTYRMEDENIADDLEQDDWAMISYNPYDDCLDIAKADVVSDTLSGIKEETGYQQFQIGGTWYNVSETNANQVSRGDTVLAYVVAGVIVDISADDGTGAIPSNIAVVIGTGGNASVYGDQVRLRYFDGTNKIVTLSDQNTVTPVEGLAYRVSGSDTNVRLETLETDREYNGYAIKSNSAAADIKADSDAGTIGTGADSRIDDNAVIILYTAGGQSKQITGKQFKAIATADLYEDSGAPSDDNTIEPGEAGAVFTKTTNGLNRVRLAAVMVDSTSVTGQSSDNYAYVTSTSYINGDGDTVINIWTGSENRTVTMDGSSNSYAKGTLIGYSTIDSNDVISDVMSFGLVDGDSTTTLTAGVDLLGATGMYRGGNEDEDGSNNSIAVAGKQLNVTSDTHVLVVDSAADREDNIGITWNNTDLPQGKKLNSTTYAINAWFSIDSADNANEADLEVLVIDTTGVFEAYDDNNSGGNQGGNISNDIEGLATSLNADGDNLTIAFNVPTGTTGLSVDYEVKVDGITAGSGTATTGGSPAITVTGTQAQFQVILNPTASSKDAVDLTLNNLVYTGVGNGATEDTINNALKQEGADITATAIPENAAIEVPKDAKLTINADAAGAGASATLSGVTFSGEGKVAVKGTVDATDVTVNGNVDMSEATVSSIGKVAVTGGNLTIDDEKIKELKSGTITINGGKLVANEIATEAQGNSKTLVGTEDARIQLAEGATATINLTPDKTSQRGTMTINGDATVPAGYTAYAMLGSAGKDLAPKGLDVTVENGTLTVNGTLKLTSGENGSSLTVAATGKVVVGEKGEVSVAKKASISVAEGASFEGTATTSKLNVTAAGDSGATITGIAGVTNHDEGNYTWDGSSSWTTGA